MVLEKFEMKYFFMIGIVAFSCSILASIYNLYTYWNVMLLPKIVADIIFIVFYCAIIIMFLNQYKVARTAPKQLDEFTLDEIVKDVKR